MRSQRIHGFYNINIEGFPIEDFTQGEDYFPRIVAIDVVWGIIKKQIAGIAIITRWYDNSGSSYEDLANVYVKQI